MKGKTFRLGVVLLGILVAACNTRTERPPNADQLRARGEVVYLEYCAECHQTDGNGWSTLYPRLAGNPIVTLHDPEPLIVTVRYGQGSMPAFGQRISNDDIGSVLTYIRTMWGNNASPVSPRQIQ